MKSIGLRGAVSGIVLCAAGFSWSSWQRHPDSRSAVPQKHKTAEAPAHNEQEAEPQISKLPLPPTLVASGPDRPQPAMVTTLEEPEPVPATDVNPDLSDEPMPEVVASNRRAAMADFWNLSEEQTKAFDTATEAPAAERLEVMMRFARGELANSDLDAELRAADDRGLQRVREVLGEERFNEYLSIRARFEVDYPELASNR